MNVLSTIEGLDAQIPISGQHELNLLAILCLLVSFYQSFLVMVL